MLVEEHKQNGKLVGWYYTLDDGRKLYMAKRTGRDMHRERQAWLFDSYHLRKLQDNKIEFIGVARSKELYLTPVSDFFGPNSFGILKGWSLRGLPAKHFMVNPGNRTRTIERKSLIKR